MKLWPFKKSLGNKAAENKPWMKFFILGFIFYFVFLIVNIPSGWAAWGLTKITKGKVTITHTLGTAWSGGGKLVIMYPRATPKDLGDMEWSFNPLWLFLGKARLNMEWKGEKVNGRASIQRSFGSTSLLNMQLNISPQFITDIYSPAALFSPSGKILLESDSLMLSQDGLKGQANIQWLGAGSGLSSVKPLGNYLLSLSAEGAKADIKLKTLNGDLQLNGRGSWDLTGNGRFSFNGTALPSTAKKSELEPFLKLLGRDLGGGRRLLRWNSQLMLLPAKKQDASVRVIKKK